MHLEYRPPGPRFWGKTSLGWAAGSDVSNDRDRKLVNFTSPIYGTYPTYFYGRSKASTKYHGHPSILLVCSQESCYPSACRRVIFLEQMTQTLTHTQKTHVSKRNFWKKDIFTAHTQPPQGSEILVPKTFGKTKLPAQPCTLSFSNKALLSRPCLRYHVHSQPYILRV